MATQAFEIVHYSMGYHDEIYKNLRCKTFADVYGCMDQYFHSVNLKKTQHFRQPISSSFIWSHTIISARSCFSAKDAHVIWYRK